MRKNIILVGFMGCGKSALGRALAKCIDLPFIDTDDYIVQQEGQSIAQIFETAGEAHFRQLEKQVISQLDQYSPSIIATGGGLPCQGDNMQLLNQLGETIYLEASPITLRLKLQIANNPRPLVANKTAAELLAYITQTLLVRNPYYTMAKHTFPAHSAPPIIMAKQIIHLLDF